MQPMKRIYSFTDDYGDSIEVVTGPAGSIGIGTLNPVILPDDEIPNLVAALQNYMSRRAKELAKGAGK